MKLQVLPMALVVMLSAASCATIPGTVTNDFCLVNTPLMPTNRIVSDYISDQDPRLAEGLISFNRFGEQECGWKF
jgi:hypothetical protein